MHLGAVAVASIVPLVVKAAVALLLLVGVVSLGTNAFSSSVPVLV